MRLGCVLACWRWYLLSPHPSREGRGLFSGGWVWLRVNRACEGESGGSGMGGG